MRVLFCLMLTVSLILFSGSLLSAQESVTSTVSVPSIEFRKYQGGHQDLKLPAEITDVSLAGQGRYLLIYMQSLRRVSVYDVNEVRIIKNLAMATDDALIVGGAAEMLVVNRSQNLLERWSLGTFQREAVKLLPIRGEVTRLELGFDSCGPLKLTWKEVRSDLTLRGNPDRYFDLQTLEEVAAPEPHLVQKLSKEEQEFNRKMGICSHPDYAISLPLRLDDKKRFPTGEGNTEHVSIFTRKPVKQLGYAEIAFMEHQDYSPLERLFTVRKRIYFIPQADQVLSIPFPSDRLHVSRLALRKLLEKEPPYLVVSSVPSKVCWRGQEWQYQLQLESSADDVSVELSAAPEGMQITESAKLTWRVPEDHQADQAFVILTLTPRGGKAKFQKFPLEVRDQ